jgi:zinc transporter
MSTTSSQQRLSFVGLPSYGSDSFGIVWAYLFSAGSGGRAIGAAEALEWATRDQGERSADFIWLHFDLANVAAEKCLRQRLALSETFFESLSDKAPSTRIEYTDDSLVAILNDVLFEFAFEPSHFSTLWLSLDQHLIITARRKPLRSVDRLRTAVTRGEPFRSTAAVLTHLLRDQADVLVHIVRKTTGRIDDIEDEVLAARHRHNREAIAAIRRVLVRLGRLLAPEPAAFFRLLNRPPPWLGEDDIQGLRKSSEEFAAALNDMTGLLERIVVLQEEVAAQINEQNNRSLFLLTIFTVLALPINIVAGLFGMNVGGIPFNQDERGFWLVVGIVATFTVAAMWVVLRKRRE